MALAVRPAMPWEASAVAFTAAALFGFGFVKARVTAMPLLRGGLQTLAVGGLAAAAAFLIARMIA